MGKVLFEWKGAPPTPDDLGDILTTPLGADLSTEFREEGTVGIQMAFANFFGIKDQATLQKRQKAQKRSLMRLSESIIQSENKAAIAASNQQRDVTPKDKHFQTIQAFRELFVHGVLELPAIADTFTEDEVFAYMRLAGPNPVMLKQVTVESSLFQKFPVSNEQYQAVYGQ